MSSDLDEDPIAAATKANEANGYGSDNNIDKEADDLFGDGGDSDEDDIGTARKRRKLSDDELDSGDDLERDDALEEQEEEAPLETRTLTTTEVYLPKGEFPTGTDGEIYLYRNPQSIGIEPHVFTAQHFEVPLTTHHSKAEAPPNFSAAHTAANTIRWRRSPNDMNEMQSNARIIRWSDGSLTMQIGSNATEQYEMTAKALAPPQIKPAKPTPVSNARAVGGKYDVKQDSHTYLASVHLEPGFAQLTNHVTASLSVVIKNDDEDDEALARLQQSMAAAISNGKPNGQGGPGVIMITEDPELAKKRAETAERDRAKALKRRQNQEDRDRDRNARVLGKAGMRPGLTAGFLEDEDRVPRRSAPRKPRRRGSDYSDDEDGFDNRRRNKEDEYDEDDGFLVKSDEEDEEGDAEGSEDEDEEDVLDDRPARPARLQPVEADADAIEEPAGEDGENVARGRHRRVVDDDDDE